MRILIVDDDPLTISAYQRTLQHQFEVYTAPSGEAALDVLRDHGPFAVVVSDMNMPGISGLELLVEIGRRAPDTSRIMLTGVENQKTAADAVNTGRVFRFLSKPCTLSTLLAAAQDGATHFQQVLRERELLEQTFNGIVHMLTEALAAADPEAFALGQRLQVRARQLAEAMKLTITWELETAALLLRIGLVTIPDAVRQKLRAGTPLTGSEADLTRRIPAIGANLLEHIPRLALVAEFIRYQEKGYDGSGEPNDSVAGDTIPVGARILRALVDLQAAENGDQPAALAFATLQKQAGSYDPAVLKALARIIAVPETATAHRSLTVEELQPGMVVDMPVLAQQGIPIISAGVRLTIMLVERLRNFADLGQIQQPIYIRNETTG